jgi:hypothetical protein
MGLTHLPTVATLSQCFPNYCIRTLSTFLCMYDMDAPTAIHPRDPPAEVKPPISNAQILEIVSNSVYSRPYRFSI